LKGGELGLDLTPARRVTVAGTVFVNRLDDAIANVTIAPNVRQRQNVRAILAKGVEVTASAALGEVGLSASYAYSRSRVDAPGTALDGLRPAQSPRHMASATAAYRPELGPSLSTTLRYVGRQYEDDLQSDSLAGAVTLDVTARLPLGRGVDLIARAENLFDEAVVTRNAGASVDLGTPRTLWLGLRWRG
jgi:iron complex outermembrane receptor protein